MKIQIIRADERHRKDLNRLIVKTKIGEPIRAPIRNFWVVRQDRRIVACAGLDFHGRTAVLTYLAVEKEFRRQGIASALIQHRIKVARERGEEILALVTMYYHFNFYKRRGFRTCPRKDLPESVRGYSMFTDRRYMKCAVMIRNIVGGT